MNDNIKIGFACTEEIGVGVFNFKGSVLKRGIDVFTIPIQEYHDLVVEYIFDELRIRVQKTGSVRFDDVAVYDSKGLQILNPAYQSVKGQDNEVLCSVIMNTDGSEWCLSGIYR